MTTIREADPALTDPERFGAVFDRYFAEIHGYAARRVGRDAAADIAAEVFLTAFRVRRTFDPSRGSVKAWLYGITTNHLSSYHRSEQRAYRAMARAGVPEQQEGHADAVIDQVAAEALRPALLAALADLTRGEREVLLLVALGGLSHADVAAALGIRYGTVASRLSRARAKLRTAAGITFPEAEEESIMDELELLRDCLPEQRPPEPGVVAAARERLHDGRRSRRVPLAGVRPARRTLLLRAGLPAAGVAVAAAVTLAVTAAGGPPPVRPPAVAAPSAHLPWARRPRPPGTPPGPATRLTRARCRPRTRAARPTAARSC